MDASHNTANSPSTKASGPEISRRKAIAGLTALAVSPLLRTRVGATELSGPIPEMRTWRGANSDKGLQAKLIDCDYADGRLWMLTDDSKQLLASARHFSNEDRAYLLSFRDTPLNQNPDERVWRPAGEGQGFFIGGYEGYDQGSKTVAFRRADGQPLSVRLDALSNEDQQFLEGLINGGNVALSHWRQIDASTGVPVARVPEAAQYVAIHKAAVHEITTVGTMRQESRVQSVFVRAPSDRSIAGQVYSSNGGAIIVGKSGIINVADGLLTGEVKFDHINPVGGSAMAGGLASDNALPGAFACVQCRRRLPQNLLALSYRDGVRVFGPPPGNFQFDITETDVRGERLQSPRGVAWTPDNQQLLIVDQALGAVFTYTPRGQRMACTGSFPERGVLNKPERVAVSLTGEVAVSLADGSVVLFDRTQRPVAVVSPLAGAGGATEEAYPVKSLHFVRGGGPHQGKLVVVRDGDGSMVYGPFLEGDVGARE